MASITIRNLDERVKQNMRKSAAAHGVSMEQEARSALAEKYRVSDDRWKTVSDVLAWVETLPLSKPLDPRYETLDHKTLTDMMWDGNL